MTTRAQQDEREKPHHDLALSLMPLVRDVAAQVARRVPSHVPMDDLIGAGSLGLAGALTRFDPERQETFRGYAEARIRGAIIDDLRRRDIMSRDARIESKKLQRSIQTLSSRLGREAEDDEVAKFLDVSLEKFRTMQLRLRSARMVSVDAIDVADDQETPFEHAGQGEVRAYLAKSLKLLPKRQATVLWLYYYEERPLKEIADRFGVTPSRICQIRTEAIDRLKSTMLPHQLAA